MIDLEVELSPELTKASRTSASTSAFYQATHVITTRDNFEEFVAAEIRPTSLSGAHGHSKCSCCPG
jgi:hypothetical protein